jgi:hypothetical protein
VGSLTFDQHMKIAARTYIVGVIDECQGNISEAARVADLNRPYMYELMERLGLRDLSKRTSVRSEVARPFKLWVSGRAERTATG